MNKIKIFIRSIIRKILQVDDGEEKNLIHFLQFIDERTKYEDGMKILEIGCGYGRNLKIVSAHGYNIVGVDINEHIVRENCQSGLNCITVEQFCQHKKEISEEYDVLLLSHVIEHFQPNKLKDFLDFYLQYLKNGGYLIISCPLYTSFFYDDFDHIKPYHPIGINQVFGNNNDQIQYYSNHILNFKDIWFRKSPYKILFKRGKYIKTYTSKIYIVIDMIFAILFRITRGLIGFTSGWSGLYQKN